MAGACWLLVANRSTLAAAEDVPSITLLSWVILAIFVAGMVTAAVMRARHPDRYARLGHFTLADPELDAAATVGRR